MAQLAPAPSNERQEKPEKLAERQPLEARAPTEPVPLARSAKQLRRSRARRIFAVFALFVLLPTLLGAVYYGAIASNQYESYSVFTIHSAEQRGVPMGGFEALLGSVGVSQSHDVLTVREYVLSRDMLLRLDKDLGFIAHYRSPEVDWWSRLTGDLSGAVSVEDAYVYYGQKVSADYDTVSGVLTLRVRAFSPEKAQRYAQAILAHSEAMVNRLSERERADRTQYAEAEVRKAELRLGAARQALIALQQKHSEFNPFETAGAALGLRTQMEGELAKARAELMELRTFLQPNTPRLKAAEARVSAIAAQVARESQRMVDPKRAEGLNASMPEFEAAMVEKEFAQKAYESAMAALELARSDAARQHRYLATIAAPSLPDESTFPRRILGVLTVFVLSFLILGISVLLIAAVREHARL